MYRICYDSRSRAYGKCWRKEDTFMCVGIVMTAEPRKFKKGIWSLFDPVYRYSSGHHFNSHVWRVLVLTRQTTVSVYLPGNNINGCKLCRKRHHMQQESVCRVQKPKISGCTRTPLHVWQQIKWLKGSFPFWTSLAETELIWEVLEKGYLFFNWCFARSFINYYSGYPGT